MTQTAIDTLQTIAIVGLALNAVLDGIVIRNLIKIARILAGMRESS